MDLLERLEQLEPQQRIKGEAKWNGYFLGNRDLGCQKIFNGVTLCVIGVL